MFKDQRTTSPHWWSPCLTNGPSGSLEMISGRTTHLAGLSDWALVEERPDASVVNTSHLPANKFSLASSLVSIGSAS